jgi:signal transduction histidine kinase
LEQRQAIFEPFRQLAPVEKKTKAGFGLGLAIARECIGSIGGSIALSSGVGKGSTFTAIFPSLDGRDHAVS